MSIVDDILKELNEISPVNVETEEKKVPVKQTFCNKSILDEYNVCDYTLIRPYTSTNLIFTNLSIEIEELFHKIPIRDDYDPPKKKRGRKKAQAPKPLVQLNDGDIITVKYKDLTRGVPKKKNQFKNAVGIDMFLKEDFDILSFEEEKINIIIPKSERKYKFTTDSITDIINIDISQPQCTNLIEKYRDKTYEEYFSILGELIEKKLFLDLVICQVMYLSRFKKNKEIFFLFFYIFDSLPSLPCTPCNKFHSDTNTVKSFLCSLIALKYSNIRLDHYIIKKCIVYLLGCIFSDCIFSSEKSDIIESQLFSKLLDIVYN